MIRTTNKTGAFITKHKGDIYIYGAAVVGYWVGYYMDKCGIEYCGYLDRDIIHEGAKFNGKPLFHPETKLCEYKDNDIRIIIATKDKYPEILRDLLWMDEKLNLQCLALTPYYLTGEVMMYDINRMMAFFRSKLVRGQIPTIICNTCLAGNIYSALGMACISPTINISMHPEDYIKFCYNLRYYASQDIDVHWERAVIIGSSREVPVGILDDIKVYFAHHTSIEKAKYEWNNGKRFINWNRIIYVISDLTQYIPIKLMNDFCKLKGEKLVINARGMTTMHESGDTVFYYQNRSGYLICPNVVIESEFDLLGWINKEYMQEN